MNDVPQLPGHLGSEDVKGLIRMQFTIALVVIKESVVRILVPLKKKEMICLKGRSMQCHQSSSTGDMGRRGEKRSKEES